MLLCSDRCKEEKTWSGEGGGRKEGKGVSEEDNFLQYLINKKTFFPHLVFYLTESDICFKKSVKLQASLLMLFLRNNLNTKTLNVGLDMGWRGGFKWN